MKYSRLAVCVLVILFSQTACNRNDKPADLPKLHAVTVTVKQDGNALPGASVSLFSEDPQFKWVLGGLTDPNGSVRIHTLGKFPGAPEGKYKVVVMKTLAEESPTGKLPVPEEPGQVKAYYAKIAEEEKEYDLIDPKYGSRETTDLEIEVVPGRNTKEFDVGEPVRVVRKKIG